jgi:hypothetical protein
MIRPIVEAIINSKSLNAILDTGARRSYILREIAEDMPKVVVEPFQTRLGGQIFKIEEGRVVEGIIKDSKGRGYRFGSILYPVGDLGQENDVRIEILFGSIILEDWGTVIDQTTHPPTIDYKRLREGNLVELPENF